MFRKVYRLVAGLVVVAVMTGTAFAETEQKPHVVATYFHRTVRCQTCLQIESLVQYDVTKLLSDDVAVGLLTWRTVNFEEEENAHFAAEFALDSPSLVITLEVGGDVLKWTRMDRVWELYDDVKAFDKYVLGTLKEYLKTASEMAVAGQASVDAR